MGHTPECEGARSGGPSLFTNSDGSTNDWPEMRRLVAEAQRAVLECPHSAHDSVRWLWRVPCRP